VTAIAAIVHDGTVWMGGDSAFQAGLSRRDRPEPKVVTRGEWVFGVAGSPRMLQLVRYEFTPPDPGPGLSHEFMCRTFTTALRSCLKDGGWDPGKDGQHGMLLAATGGRLFRICSDFQVAEEAPFTAIGCGGDLALGSLFTTQTALWMAPQNRLARALEAAERFSTGVRGPWCIRQTADSPG
jgi:hypothetical protein